MIMDIGIIEEKIINKEELANGELTFFLDNLIAVINDIINESSYINKCDAVQGLIGRYFKRLGIPTFANITNKCVSSNVIGHSFVVASFRDYNQGDYIIDPSFIQFLYLNDDYDDLYINHLRIKSKSPFYYARAIDKELTLELLRKGYLKLTSRSAYLYGNCFLHTKVCISDDSVIDNIDGNIYINSFFKGNEQLRVYDYPDIEISSNKRR